LIELPLRTGDDRDESGLLEAIVRVEGIDRFGRVADHDQNFGFV
jgi:hypothetical protein